MCAKKSIWSTRSIMAEHGLYDAVFDAIGDELGKVFEGTPLCNE